ncbi:hypothetical protein HYV73_00785 [Candidatus Uhrbacteria bacterium]|nr:hypothetical protein [Candidatus Uhrbacteria bacterium]
MFAQMIRYYNGGFDHWKLLRLTYKQFLMYYSCLMDMLESENGKKTDRPKKDPLEAMKEVKNIIQS